MNPGTLTLPLRAVTIKKGSEYISVSINPSLIQSAITSGSGSSGLLFFGDSPTAFTSTSSPATLLLGLPYIPVTIAGVVTYIPTAMMQNWRTPPTGSGCSIDLLTNPIGREYQTVTVSESKATVDAAYEAVAAAAGGGGGSFGSITATGATQGTAAAITTSVVRITGGAAATGVILTTATGAEECYVHNATTSTKVIYPATGEFIDPSLVNEGVTIGAGEAILFKCTLAAHWSSEMQVSNTQVVTPTGLVQGGGQIKTGVTNVLVNTTAGINTAITLPPATVGYAISLSIATTVASVEVFPSGTDQINLSGAGTSILLKANSTQALVCHEAGYWVDASSAVKNLIAETIAPRIAGADVTILNSVGASIAAFGTDINLFKELALFSVVAATATPGGNQATGVRVDANVFNITTCATLGDSATMGAAEFVYIKNDGVASAYLYTYVGGSMNGVLNGYIIIAPGQMYVVRVMVGGFYSTLLYSPAGSYVAAAGVAGPRIVHPASVVTTVTNPGDAVGLSYQCTSVVIKNNGANALTVNPPAVGETINGLTSLLCPIGSVVNITQTTATDWTATFDSPGRQSGTAFAGGGASGTPIIGSSVNVTTVAVANDSFAIQPFTPRLFFFANNTLNACDVFPPSGGTVNGGASISIAAAGEYIFFSNDGSTWLAVVK